MKSGVNLYLASSVGAKNDIQIMAQNLATVEQEDSGHIFEAAVANFIEQLAESVNKQSANLHTTTIKLYQTLARKKLKFNGGSYFIELPLEARVEAVTLMYVLAQSLDLILYIEEPN